MVAFRTYLRKWEAKQLRRPSLKARDSDHPSLLQAYTTNYPYAQILIQRLYRFKCDQLQSQNKTL